MHPTSGEIMTGGSMGGMSMSGGMAMDTRHLKVHVFSRATKQVIKTARCGITVINRATGKRTKVPIATMYGIKEGPADWHYGNNVDAPAGVYDVLVAVNGEQATFHVTVPAAKM